MSTSYPSRDFKDDYALGMSLNLGGKITYAEHWRLHAGYRMFANVASSDIWNADPTTGQGNRYEVGLFDLLDTRDRFFGKLETLSLEYFTEKFSIKAGRMGINTDWVNPQDGRLSPTAVEGLHLSYRPDDKWALRLWMIGRMSIRGSSGWMGVGETVGVFPVGRSVEGGPSRYFGNTESKWIGIAEVGRTLGEGLEGSFSQTLAHNLFSTTSLKLERRRKLGAGTGMAGVQSSLQLGVGEGGNADPQLRYKDPGDANYALSARAGWSTSRWTTHLNYTHVGGGGRWLSPREWGKDPWYSFIPRERNEGYQQVDALSLYGEYKMERANLDVYAHAGLHWLADRDDPAGNKYNFPSYRQLNLGLKYHPRSVKNADIHLLFVAKGPLGEEELTPNQIYNKVEMLHVNAILNWRWH